MFFIRLRLICNFVLRLDRGPASGCRRGLPVGRHAQWSSRPTPSCLSCQNFFTPSQGFQRFSFFSEGVFNVWLRASPCGDSFKTLKIKSVKGRVHDETFCEGFECFRTFFDGLACSGFQNKPPNEHCVYLAFRFCGLYNCGAFLQRVLVNPAENLPNAN